MKCRNDMKSDTSCGFVLASSGPSNSGAPATEAKVSGAGDSLTSGKTGEAGRLRRLLPAPKARKSGDEMASYRTRLEAASQIKHKFNHPRRKPMGYPN